MMKYRLILPFAAALGAGLLSGCGESNVAPSATTQSQTVEQQLDELSADGNAALQMLSEEVQRLLARNNLKGILENVVVVPGSIRMDANSETASASVRHSSTVDVFVVRDDGAWKVSWSDGSTGMAGFAIRNLPEDLKTVESLARWFGDDPANVEQCHVATGTESQLTFADFAGLGQTIGGWEEVNVRYLEGATRHKLTLTAFGRSHSIKLNLEQEDGSRKIESIALIDEIEPAEFFRQINLLETGAE